eukprot:118391-Chlamydomonas_euryale.AAC.2
MTDRRGTAAPREGAPRGGEVRQQERVRQWKRVRQGGCAKEEGAPRGGGAPTGEGAPMEEGAPRRRVHQGGGETAGQELLAGWREGRPRFAGRLRGGHVEVCWQGGGRAGQELLREVQERLGEVRLKRSRSARGGCMGSARGVCM